MYNRILVPIDGSDTSNSALKEAIALAKDQHSTLRLFHVVDLTKTYSSVQAPHIPEHQEALQHFTKPRRFCWCAPRDGRGLRPGR
jgi:nucleotide-binding universal stress UspA family protein